MAHPFKKQTRNSGAPSVLKLKVLHSPHADWEPWVLEAEETLE